MRTGPTGCGLSIKIVHLYMVSLERKLTLVFMNINTIVTLALGLLLWTSCANEPEGSSDKYGMDSTATAAPAAIPVAAAVYICPMDTDVVSPAPGKCPKCGMDLVEKK
jgi:hypothetical protein